MHYAFVVGVNTDWPEQRTTHGDKALASCLSRDCHLPSENLVSIFDEHATRSNILNALETLLDHRNAERNKRCQQASYEVDKLLFYYGGHGKRDEFCTHTRNHVNPSEQEPWIKHYEIIDILERKFHGGVVWALVDCCHSGGFGEALMKYNASDQSLNVQYGCIMSTPAPATAGEEWTITECFVKAFRGDLSYVSDADAHYLSIRPCSKTAEDTTKNKEGKQQSKLQIKRGTHPTFAQVIEFLSDEMVRIKNERLTTLFCGRSMEDGTYLNQRCLFGDTTPIDAAQNDPINAQNDSGAIARDSSWMTPFVGRKYAVNDEVFVKWNGPSKSTYPDEYESSDEPDDMRYMLGWFPGRILSLHQDGGDAASLFAYIELRDEISESRWTTMQQIDGGEDFCKSKILHGLPFGFGLDPQKCATAVASLAKDLCYIDTSLPPWTRIRVLWKDGEFYDASVMCPTEVDWDNIKDMVPKYANGPCVPVEWEEEGSFSIVPVRWCVVLDTNRHVAEGSMESDCDKVEKFAKKMDKEWAERNLAPVDVMLESFKSAKKKFHGNLPIFDTVSLDEQNNFSWEAFDAENCEWLPVQPMNKIDATILPLEVLAYHMCYRESGSYSVVFWKNDSVLSMVPNSLLRIRPAKNPDGENGSDETSMEDYGEMHEVSYNVSVNNNGKSEQIIWRMSCIAVVFGLGYLIGAQKIRK